MHQLAVTSPVFCEGVVAILGNLMWAGLIGAENLVWPSRLLVWRGWLGNPESFIMMRTTILRSSALCVQVYWLLNAIAQDHPKLKGAAELRDSCEQAALEGYWVRCLQGVLADPVLLALLCLHAVACSCCGTSLTLWPASLWSDLPAVQVSCSAIACIGLRRSA